MLSPFFFEYKSHQYIKVYDPAIGILYKLLVVAILSFVVIYNIIVNEGYFDYDSIVGTGTSTVEYKGSVATSINDNTYVWNTDDIIVNPLEHNALFFNTAVKITPNQTQGVCTNAWCFRCDSDSDCFNGLYNPYGFGKLTGECNMQTHTCMSLSWCPMENPNSDNVSILNNTGRITALIWLQVYYPKFDVTVSNINSVWNNSDAPKVGYNLFTPDWIVGNATNGALYTRDLPFGAVILMITSWNCNVDHVKNCRPTYFFKRIDGVKNSIEQRGYYIKTVSYDHGILNTRHLIKRYGIRVLILYDGQARKFSFSVLTITFGAGLAYLTFATIISDFVMNRCLKNSVKYRQQQTKYIRLPTELPLQQLNE